MKKFYLFLGIQGPHDIEPLDLSAVSVRKSFQVESQIAGHVKMTA